MRPVTISSKYRITIPLDIRERFGIKPGHKVVFVPYQGSLRMEFISPSEEAQGFLQGMDTTVEREEEEER